MIVTVHRGDGSGCMRNYRLALSLISCLALFSSCAFAAPDKCTAAKPIPFPNGVSDPDGKVGYVANGAGGIAALDLLTGKTLWSSDEASRPLLVAKNRLIAESVESTSRNIFQISVIDTKQKGKLLYHASVPFPSWVEIAAANNNEFSMDVTLNDNCVVVIRWQAQSRYKGGAPPPEQIEQRDAKNASGVVHIDLETGKVESLNTPHTTNQTTASLSDQSSWRFEPDAREAFAIGSRVYYLVDNTGDKTTLKARDLSSGKLLWEITLQNQKRIKIPPPP